MQSELPRGWTLQRAGAFLSGSQIPGSTGLTAEKLTVKLYGRGVFAKQDRTPGSKNTKYFTRRKGQFIYSKLDFLNGAFGIVPPELDGRESTGDLPAFDIAQDVSPAWLLYYVSRPDFYERQGTSAIGSRKARRVSPMEFLQLELPTPPLAEQKKIAAILSSVDEAIQTTQAVIEQTRRVKEGLLQQLLVEGLRHGQTVKGPHGENPAVWDVVPLGVVSSLVTKGTTPPKGTMRRAGQVPYLRVGNLTFSGRLDLSDLLFIDRSIHEGVLKRSRAVPGDVLTNIVGPPLGQVALVDERFTEWNMNQAIAIFRSDKTRLMPEFLALFLQWSMAQWWLLNRAKQTSGQVNLTLELCRELPLPLPELAEQREIVEHVAAVDAVLQRSKLAARQLVAAKAGLLQVLLTGTVRVSP